MLASKRRRGTVIVDTLRGILVVSHENRTFYLPGGGAEKDESFKAAAIRELKEETNLKTVTCRFLFVFESFSANHEVFLIETCGVAKPSSEIRYLDYFTGSNLKVSNATWEILELYRAIRAAEKKLA